MSTRAVFALKMKDNNSVIASSVTCDGYPLYTGKLLIEFYSTYDKINTLINLGNLTSLQPEITNIEFDKDSWSAEPFPKEFNNLEKFSTFINENNWIEFTYLFENEKWKIFPSYKELSLIINEMELLEKHSTIRNTLEKQSNLPAITIGYLYSILYKINIPCTIYTYETVSFALEKCIFITTSEGLAFIKVGNELLCLNLTLDEHPESNTLHQKYKNDNLVIHLATKVKKTKEGYFEENGILLVMNKSWKTSFEIKGLRYMNPNFQFILAKVKSRIRKFIEN